MMFDTDLHDLWITRVEGAKPELTGDAHFLYETLDLTNRLPSPIVVGADRTRLREELITALQAYAYEGRHPARGQSPSGYLAVHVPTTELMDYEAIMRRVVRRLYLAAVVHGLNEVQTMRDVVQAMRLTYLQTRGTVTLGRNRAQRSVTQGGGEASLGGSISLTGVKIDAKLGEKLTASEEVAVAESLSAEMERADFFESEDQLLTDLMLLRELDLFVNQYMEKVKRPGLPRLEKIRLFFRDVYAALHNAQQLRITPLVVLDDDGRAESKGLFEFLKNARSLASYPGLRLIVLADEDFRERLSKAGDVPLRHEYRFIRLPPTSAINQLAPPRVPAAPAPATDGPPPDPTASATAPDEPAPDLVAGATATDDSAADPAAGAGG